MYLYSPYGLEKSIFSLYGLEKENLHSLFGLQMDVHVHVHVHVCTCTCTLHVHGYVQRYCVVVWGEWFLCRPSGYHHHLYQSWGLRSKVENSLLRHLELVLHCPTWLSLPSTSRCIHTRQNMYELYDEYFQLSHCSVISIEKFVVCFNRSSNYSDIAHVIGLTSVITALRMHLIG